METCSTLSMRQEQQEKSLFLFVVVVSYIVTFTVASNGGTRYSITQLLMGIIFGVYLIPGFFETEVLQRFSAHTRNAIFFPNSGRDDIGWTLGSRGNWLIGVPLAGLPWSDYLLVHAGWCMLDCSRRSFYPACVPQQGILH